MPASGPAVRHYIRGSSLGENQAKYMPPTAPCRVFERNSWERVLHYAQKQVCNRPNDNAADRAPLDIAHPSPANAASCWSEQGAAAKTKTNNGGSGAGR
jgi:hypothetical protein